MKYAITASGKPCMRLQDACDGRVDDEIGVLLPLATGE